MTRDPDAPVVQRLDDRLGLAVERVIVSARTVVTYTRDHVVVRTPSYPNDRLGNALDLVDVPDTSALPTWVKRFKDTVGMIGAHTTRIRFEIPADTSTPHDVLEWFTQNRFQVRQNTVYLADASVPAGRVTEDIRLLSDAPVGSNVVFDRMWFAADVLDRYRQGSTVEEYLPRDDTEHTETAAVLREHAVSQRSQVFVAYRYGTPVGRIAATHDRQGLVAIHALVVHPVHRRSGIGTALLATALAGYDEHAPKVRFGVSVPHGNPVATMLANEGFRPHADVITAERT